MADPDLHIRGGWGDGHDIYMFLSLLVTCSCRFQNVLLVSVKFFPSFARAGLVEELRHLYVVVILWSGACARSKILR